MIRRIILLATFVASAILLPSTATARWMNPSTGRFITMDSYEGQRIDPQSLHKYAYCANQPVNGVDPSGLKLWLCTRRTADEAPVYGHFRHCYIWDDRTNVVAYMDNPPAGVVKLHRSVGQELSSGSGETWEERDIGPIAGQINVLPSDTLALEIEGSTGHEDEIMDYGRKHINGSWYWFFLINDCHNAAERVLKHFPYLKIPPHDRLNYDELPQRYFNNANTGIDYLFRRMYPMDIPMGGYP